MEESIRNAEKLIQAANTALAEMKFDVCYDDFCFAAGSKIDQRKRIVTQDENYQTGSIKEKMSNADELFVLENLSGLRSNSSPINNDAKIEEINNKIEVYKQQLLDREERHSTKALQLGVFKLEGLVSSRSAEEAAPAGRTASDTILPQRIVSTARDAAGAANIAEDLNSKLIQTQEIVSRGIQTARELNETVDSLRNKHLKSDEGSSIVHASKAKTSEKPIEKSNSRSSIKSVEVKRCRRCNAELVSKQENKPKMPKSEENVAIVRIKERDCSQSKCNNRKLQKQRLPNLSIRGGLSWQKIPGINILPGEPERCSSVRVNAALETCSHEQILKDRIGKFIEDTKKSNGSFLVEKCRTKKNVECSNCGKIIAVSDRIVDAEKIDELLKICDYNVFDPRIDEFVEKCGRKMNDEAKFTQTDQGMNEVKFTTDGVVDGRKDKVERESTVKPSIRSKKEEEFVEEIPQEEKRGRISDLSQELTRKYQEKAVQLENDHLHFESILRDLFKKVDESRKIFQDCDFLHTIAEEGHPKRSSNLSSTAPVLVSFSGSGCEEVDDGTNAVIRPSKHQYVKKNKMSAKDIKRRLEKRELRTNCKILSSSDAAKEKPSSNPFAAEDGGRRKVEALPTRHVSHFRRIVSPSKQSSGDTDESSDYVAEETKKEIANRQRLRVENVKVPISLYSDVPHLMMRTSLGGAVASRINSPVNVTPVEESDKATAIETVQKVERDYESDFEESIEEGTPEIVEEQADLNAEDCSYKYNVRLSTISEVDSELDRKTGYFQSSTGAEEEDNLEELDKSVEKDKPEDDGEAPLGQSHNRTLTESVVNFPEQIPEKEQTPPAYATVSPRGTLSSDEDTRKLLKRVNRELREVASQQLLSAETGRKMRNFPQEMTEPLKEVLDALKNQFERTEQLADRLTESLKDTKSNEDEAKKFESFRDMHVSLEELDSRVLDKLQRTRKNAETDAKNIHVRHNIYGLEMLHALHGSALEQTGSSRKLLENMERSKRLIKLKLNDEENRPVSTVDSVQEDVELPSSNGSESGPEEEKSYSEGEISEQEFLCIESSSPSIGEVINGND